MAVTLRGYTQGTFSSTGAQSVAWPSGTVAGDVAVVFCATGSDKKPTTALPSGWTRAYVTSDGVSVWWKRLVTGDLASALALTARVQLLQVFAGAAGVGKTGRGESMALTQDGGAFLLCGWKSTTDDLTASAKIHATDVVNSSYLYKGTARKFNTWWVALATKGTAYIDTNASAFLAIEILPQVAPYAPTLLLPDDEAYVDCPGDMDFRWKNNTVGGIPPAAVRLRVTVHRTFPDPTLVYYLSDATGWSTSVQSMPGYSGLSGVYTGPLGVNHSCTWAVASSADGSTFGPYSDNRTFTTNAKPTVTVSVSGSGLTRTVSWTPTITNGVQVWWRVRICPSADTSPANPIYDTGIVSGADASTVIPATAGWTNGASYKAWVEFGQTGGQQTVPTASSAFTVSWTPPAAPTSVTAQPSSRPMTVSANGLTGSHSRIRLSFTANGTTYTIYATAVVGTVSFDVPLAPYMVATDYSVEASQVVSGVELWSDPVTVTAVCGDMAAYLVAADLSSSLLVHVRSGGSRVDTEGITVSGGIGARRPSTIRTPSQGWASKDEIELLTKTRDEWVALYDWMAANPTFIFRYPPERDVATYADVPALPMSRTSQLPDERVVDKQVQLRTLAFSWVEQ